MDLYSVRDEKANCSYEPQIFKTQVDAIRFFDQAIQNRNTMINKYPDDFTLYKIGSFDERTGIIVDVKVEKIVTAPELIRMREATNDNKDS